MLLSNPNKIIVAIQTMMNSFDTELFISEIHKRPSIWDTSFPEYTNKELKKKNWEEVIDIFAGDDVSQSDKHILGFTLKRRWKNIRTCFARELKRQKNYGSGAGRKSEYLYYKQLLFLINVMNIAEKDVDEEPEYMYYDDNDTDTSASENVKKCKRKSSDDEDSCSDNEDDDEDRLFLLSLHKTLKRIPKTKKMAVKIKMLSILNDVLLKDKKCRLYE